MAEKHIWLVTGPAGTGKSTIAEFLAEKLNISYLEGDEENIDNMRSGIPLTDLDRWDWLTLLREESLRRIAPVASESSSDEADAVVLTCSALKRKYRDVIRVAPYFHPQVRLHFVFLYGTKDLLVGRVSQRKGHYMGASMVESQLAILEIPGPDETDARTFDVAGSLEDIKADVTEYVDAILGTHADHKSDHGKA